MKLLIAAIFSIGALCTQSAIACMPAPQGTPQITLQLPWVNKLLTDEVVNQKIKEVAGASATITSISFKEGFKIEMSNGCIIVATTDSTNSRPGECPILRPLKVESVVCPAN